LICFKNFGEILQIGEEKVKKKVTKTEIKRNVMKQKTLQINGLKGFERL